MKCVFLRGAMQCFLELRDHDDKAPFVGKWMPKEDRRGRAGVAPATVEDEAAMGKDTDPNPGTPSASGQAGQFGEGHIQFEEAGHGGCDGQTELCPRTEPDVHRDGLATSDRDALLQGEVSQQVAEQWLYPAVGISFDVDRRGNPGLENEPRFINRDAEAPKAPA